MAGRASAFAALGLQPGADAAAIEQAYKRLIKQHHPDREGGDSSRAAEINRAYRELRGGRAPPIRSSSTDYDSAAPAPRWPLAAHRRRGGAARTGVLDGAERSRRRFLGRRSEVSGDRQARERAPDPIDRRSTTRRSTRRCGTLCVSIAT